MTLNLYLSVRWCSWRSLAHNWYAGQRYRGTHNGRQIQTGEETGHGKETGQRHRRTHQGWERTAGGKACLFVQGWFYMFRVALKIVAGFDFFFSILSLVNNFGQTFEA